MVNDPAGEPPSTAHDSRPRRDRPVWSVAALRRVVRLRARLSGLEVLLRSLAGRLLPNEQQHLFALTLAVGVVCGFVAVVFHLAIQAAEAQLIDRALRARGTDWMAWTVITPTLGGLLAGAALTWIVPGARGSGIPQVKQAFAVEGGRVRFRDALGKFIVGTLQIGSGASLGREGPTVQICAGATSLLARATSLPARQMRRLTPVGVAAGIAAAFNAPIAAVTFTIEEIVGQLDQAVLSGVVIAAALAAVIEREILGVHPVIEVDRTYGLDDPASLLLYAVLGLAAAVVSVGFTESLLRLRLAFRSLRFVPSWMHPGIGGLVTGVLAVLMLQLLATGGVTGGGYETLSQALAGQLSLRVLAVLCVVKLVATVFSYSSGGAGGIFAPSLFVGAMLGGAVGHLDVFLFGHGDRELGAFALVGMGAVFAGTIRAPMTSVLIIFEMTGGYGLVLPLMVANMTSYALARRLRPTPIYVALLEQDGVVLPEVAAPPHALERLRVEDAMMREVVSLHVEDTVGSGLARLGARAFSKLPVVDSEGSAIVGMVQVDQLRSAADASQPVASLLREAPMIRADAPLGQAVVRMNDLGVRQLLVVDGEKEASLVGVLSMSDLVRAHARALPTTPRVLHQSGSIPTLLARELMVTPTLVPGETRLEELVSQEREFGAKAFVVRDGGQGFGVFLPDAFREFVKDEGLRKIIIAADLAQRGPTVADGASVGQLLEAMKGKSIEAVVVVEPRTGAPLGVVTRAALGAALLDWFGQHGLSSEALNDHGLGASARPNGAGG